jgi:hypothetical protein
MPRKHGFAIGIRRNSNHARKLVSRMFVPGVAGNAGPRLVEEYSSKTDHRLFTVVQEEMPATPNAEPKRCCISGMFRNPLTGSGSPYIPATCCGWTQV